MAGASKRTTCGLALVAIIFIIVIIILCLVPDPCRRHDPRPECKPDYGEANPVIGDKTSTTNQSTTPTSTTTATASTTTASTTTASTPTASTTTASTTTQFTTTTLGTISDEETPTPTKDATRESTTPDETTIVTTTAGTTFGHNETTTVATTIVLNETTNAATSIGHDETTTAGTTFGHDETTTVATTIVLNEMTTSATSIGHDETTNASTTFGHDETTTVATTIILNETTTAATSIGHDETTSAGTTFGHDETTTVATTIVLNETTTAATSIGHDETTTAETTFGHDETTTVATTIVLNETTTAATSIGHDETTTASTTIEESSETTSIAPETTAIMINTSGVCDTPICREVARRMLDIMDPSDVNPCEDFYQFSCGGVLDDPFLKPEDPQMPADMLIKEALANANRDDPELKELLVFYDSCMNYTNSNGPEERLLAAKDAFNDLGYTFNPRSTYEDEFLDHDETFNLAEALAKMMQRHFSPFFDITLDVDEANRHEFVYKMTLPTFTSVFSGDLAKQVCFSEYKTKADEAKRNRETFDINSNYKDFVNCTTEGSGKEAVLNKIEEAVTNLNLTGFIQDNTKRGQIVSEARFNLDIMLIEIGKVMPSPPEIRKTIRTKDYEVFTIKQIDNHEAFGELPFKFSNFLKTLLDKSLNADETKIQVYFKDVFTKIFNIIYDNYEEQEPAMQNIMMLLWTDRVYGDLVKPVGQTLGSPDYCFSAVTNLMDDYVSYLYMKELPGREGLQKKMNKMITLTKTVTNTQLDTSGLNSRSDHMDKLGTMSGEVANLEDAQDSLLDDELETISVSENNFVENYISLMKHYRKRLYLIADGDPTHHNSMWSVLQFPYKANGVTSYGLNKFLIPYAAMSPPLYYDGVPSYINYAGVGHMISHELMHGFDSTGIKYNYERKEDMDSDKSLVGHSECLGEQLLQPQIMNSSTGFSAQFRLHDKLALDELLADSAATTLAWDTYQQDLLEQRSPRRTTTPETTSQQLDVHSRRRRRDVERRMLAVEGIRNRVKRSDLDLEILKDQRLIHLENYTPLQTYYIKTAQNQCSATSEVNIVSVMENEHLPPKMRINMMLGNDPKFMKAFQCLPNSPMVPAGGSCKGPT